MTRFAAFSLLLTLFCLLSQPATAQAISPLPVRVVQLLPGDVVRERLIGLDSATYAQTRTALARARPLMLAADAYQADLRRQLSLADSLSTVTAAELRRCRQQATASEAEFQQLAAAARKAAEKPPARGWLLDGNTYRGAAGGALLLVALKIFLHF